MKASVKAEWDKPDIVFVNRPGIETLLANVFPQGALFQGFVDTYEAMKEHDDFVAEIQKTGAKVENINGWLLEGTMDENGRAIESPKLDNLRELAQYSTSINFENLNLTDKKRMAETEAMRIEFMNPRELVSYIMLQPSTTPRYTPKNTGFDMDMRVTPLYNMLFSRDQQITTDNGIIISNLNASQRRSESEVTKLAFDNYGVENVYTLSEESRLEGGDFMPAGDIALIGTGLRTNKQAIDEMLKNKMFGYEKVLVVNDKKESQEEMHLDTYLNLVSSKTAVILQERYCDLERKQTEVDTYVKNDKGEYNMLKNESGLSLDKALAINGIVGRVSLTKDEQLAYGINFLTVGEDNTIGVDIKEKEIMKEKTIRAQEKHGKGFGTMDTSIDYVKLGEGLEKKFKEAGVSYKPLSFNNLNMMYGGPHCLTQVIKRS